MVTLDYILITLNKSCVCALKGKKGKLSSFFNYELVTFILSTCSSESY